jgi:predicted RNA-binding Zn-ribbon protein involved in translation (DUF1610 family)
MEIEESWGDEWSDDEVDYGDDAWDDDDSHTIACPACGDDVYEDAEQCPHCGEYIIGASLNSRYAWQNRPMWWIVLGFAGIVAVVWMLVF